jgi:hypothetical protein
MFQVLGVDNREDSKGMIKTASDKNPRSGDAFRPATVRRPEDQLSRVVVQSFVCECRGSECLASL